jgi:hypothetical protein
MFVRGFVIAGLDYRYQWSALPEWAVTTAACLFVFAYLLYAEVLRENTYLSRTVEVQEDQILLSLSVRLCSGPQHGNTNAELVVNTVVSMCKHGHVISLETENIPEEEQCGFHLMEHRFTKFGTNR